MNSLLTAVLPLSLGAIVSPAVLTAAVLVLSSRVSARARTWAFTLGMVLTLAALTLAAPVIGKALSAVSPRVVDSVDVALGLVLLALAAWQVSARHAPSSAARKKAPPRKGTGRPRLAEYLGFGFVMTVTDFSSIILYLAALKDIARSSEPVAARVAVLAIPFVAVILPALVPAVLGTLAPGLADRMLKPFAEWVGRHSKAIAVAISVVFGLYLVLKGLPPLLR